MGTSAVLSRYNRHSFTEPLSAEPASGEMQHIKLLSIGSLSKAAATGSKSVIVGQRRGLKSLELS